MKVWEDSDDYKPFIDYKLLPVDNMNEKISPKPRRCTITDPFDINTEYIMYQCTKCNRLVKPYNTTICPCCGGCHYQRVAMKNF